MTSLGLVQLAAAMRDPLRGISGKSDAIATPDMLAWLQKNTLASTVKHAASLVKELEKAGERIPAQITLDLFGLYSIAVWG